MGKKQSKDKRIDAPEIEYLLLGIYLNLFGRRAK